MMSLDVFIILLFILLVYSDATCQVTNCAQCIDNSEYVCDSCNDGFWLESGACKQCPSHCSLCTHSSQCHSCVTSYWSLGQMCNIACSSNCKDSSCEDTKGYCYQCNQGKYGQTCKQDCSLCINGQCDQRKCTVGCNDGYVQTNTDTGYSYCRPCSSNCIHCSNATYCSQCNEGFYGYYYRNAYGRGTRTCTQCLEQCTRCTSNDQCLECNSECIKQGCDVSGGCVTTRSTSSTISCTPTRVLFNWVTICGVATASSTKSSTTSKVTQPLTEKYPTPTQTLSSGQTTHQPICPNKCKDNCDARGKCHSTTANNSKLDEDYYEGFGHGIATGIGILIVVGTVIGVLIFFTRRTKCLRTICSNKSTSYSRENHVYVNTQEDTGTTPMSRNRPLHNEINSNSDIHVTLSEEDVDTNREYVSLGERQPENHYSDLQTNIRDDQ